MGNGIDKAVTIKNFSRYAHLYDENSNVQNEAAKMLLKRLTGRDAGSILEIGCGTGNYTFLLREMFRESRITAVDISEAMIRIASGKIAGEKTDFLAGDAELMDFGGTFDIITSNAAFHWLNDFEKMVEKLQNSLKKHGILAFSMFGPLTFLELKKSLTSIMGKDIQITSDLFYDKKKIELILRRHFKEVRITERLVRETHTSLAGLLKKIKCSGTRGSGTGMKRVWSSGLLNKIEEKYLECFGSIEATYQIFFCEAGSQVIHNVGDV